MKKVFNCVDDLTLAFKGKTLVRDADGNTYDFINGFLCCFNASGDKIVNTSVSFKKDYFYTLIEPEIEK